jgi:hypothetical protein
MKKTYNLGSPKNEIMLSVKVGTVGVAHSVAYLYRSGGERITLAESSTTSGDIKPQIIGTSAFLKGGYLLVYTMIDFSTVPLQYREQAIANTLIAYELSGGDSGNMSFSTDADDIHFNQDRSIMVVSKPVQML